MKDLHQLRAELDALDQELLGLIEKRVDISREIGAYKRMHALPIQDAQREQQMLQSRTRMLQKKENQGWLRAFMLLLFRISRREQRRGQNVYLIGPSSSENTRIAKQLGESTGMNVLDTRELMASLGSSEHIEHEGELSALTQAHRALVEAARIGASIVSVGEDVLTFSENLPVLRSSGRVVYLKKAEENAAVQVYQTVADITLDPQDPQTLQILWDYCIE